MRNILCFFVFALFLVACSTPSSAEDKPIEPENTSLTQPHNSVQTQNTNTSLPTSTSEISATSSTVPSQEVILSDLMKKIRDTIGPLLKGGADAETANTQMEELFKKIKAAAPEEWKDQWSVIINEALEGTPNRRGLRPWSSACKKCHDTFQKKYKKQYHTRVIPITL